MKLEKNILRSLIKTAIKEEYKKWPIEDGNELDKNETPITEAKKVKYKSNDWKKINKIAKKKTVMIQTAFGDEFKWEEGSSDGVFGTESNGREIELTHDDIDVLFIEAKLLKGAKKIGKTPQPKDFKGDIEKYLDALNKHMKDVEKSMKEGKLNEVNKNHFLKLLADEAKSLIGQKKYVQKALKSKDLENWERKEYDAVYEEILDRQKELKIHINNVQQMSEGKLTEMNEPWFEISYKDSRGRKKTDSMRAKNPKEAKKDFENLMKGRGFKVLKVVKEGKLNEEKPYETILRQLGGNKFIAMTGAKNLGTSTKKDLSFSIGRNSKKITHVKITLTSADLYDMEFINARGAKIKVVKKVTGVYNDMLGKIFTKYTGMNTRL